MTNTNSLFLTSEEIKELTGYERPSCQIRQLRAQGIRFFVRADGHPKVARSEIEGKRTERKTVPDFEALARRIRAQ